MQRTPRSLLAAMMLAGLLVPQLADAAAAAKKYQVTGTVTALTETVVTVQKADGEKWELKRDPASVVAGELKVGQRVTIQYTMMAESVDVKK